MGGNKMVKVGRGGIHHNFLRKNLVVPSTTHRWRCLAIMMKNCRTFFIIKSRELSNTEASFFIFL